MIELIHPGGTIALAAETVGELSTLYLDFMTSTEQNLRKGLSTLPLSIPHEETKGEA